MENLEDFEKKKQTTITIRPSLTKAAKEAGINVSEVAEIALERELNAATKSHYAKALELQLSLTRKFLLEFGMLQKFEEWKFASKEEQEALKKQHEDTTIDEVLSVAKDNNSDSIRTIQTTTDTLISPAAQLI